MFGSRSWPAFFTLILAPCKASRARGCAPSPQMPGRQHHQVAVAGGLTETAEGSRERNGSSPKESKSSSWLSTAHRRSLQTYWLRVSQAFCRSSHLRRELRLPKRVSHVVDAARLGAPLAGVHHDLSVRAPPRRRGRATAGRFRARDRPLGSDTVLSQSWAAGSRQVERQRVAEVEDAR